MLFQGTFIFPAIRGAFYDVSPDSQRFLMVKGLFDLTDDDDGESKIIIVENWFSELERLVPTD